jgi:ATP-binding cassette subfamily B protein
MVLVKQHDITDCGAACIASVAGHYGRRLPISRIRQYASTDQQGTNILGMVAAATHLGFLAKGLKGPFDALKSVPRPVIVHLVLAGGYQHFVVLYDLTGRHVVVMDPADGTIRRLRHEAFRAQWTGVLVVLVPGNIFQTGGSPSGIGRRFWLLARPHRATLAQAGVGAIVHTVLGLATAVYVQKLMDHAIPGANLNLLNLLSIGMLIIVAAQLCIGWVRDRLLLASGQQIDAALILGYYHHLLRLPQQFFDTMRVGELLSRINDAVKIRAFVNDIALDLLISVLVIALSFALMVAYSPPLALMVALTLPAYGIIYLVSNWLNRQTQRDLMERAADLETQLVESVGAVTTIKRFGLEDYAALRAEVRFVRLLRSSYRSALTGISAGTAVEGVSRVATIGLLWMGGALVINRGLSLGELMSFYAIIGYLTGPVGSLIGANRAIQDALIASDRLFEIMDLERETSSQAQLSADPRGDVRLENVTFRYGARAPVLSGVSLVMPRGMTTAIVGESGSGKSTIAHLLQALYPLESGRVTIGGMDLRYVPTDVVRRLIATVPQKVDLFGGDVIENIAPGDFEPDMRRILDISADLGITGFIEALPAGFRTFLGENGATLSGGQRQRIAIARALYRDPEILVMDEATSSLDSISEEHVRSTMDGWKGRGKTTVVIAHRASTVAAADRVYFLAAGKVAAEGTHADLLATCEGYRKLWAGDEVLINDAPRAEREPWIATVRG